MPDSDEQSFSQDELDALFSKPEDSADSSAEGAAAPSGDGGSDAPQAPTPESQDDAADTGGDSSQADIDALMNAGPTGDEAAVEAPADAGGDFSQADIDALMSGGAADEASGAKAPADAGGDAEFSQADIDALMGGAADADGSSPQSEAEPEGEVAFSQADIDVLADGGEPGEASAPAQPSTPEPDERLDTMGRPFDEFAAAMQSAIDDENAEAAAATPAAQPGLPPTPPPPTEALPLTDFSASPPADSDAHRVSMLHDVQLGVKIELGRTRMLLEDVLRMDEGSVVELDKLAGDPVDVYANDRLVARGEVLILNDNFCVRISEVITQDPHRVTT